MKIRAVIVISAVLCTGWIPVTNFCGISAIEFFQKRKPHWPVISTNGLGEPLIPTETLLVSLTQDSNHHFGEAERKLQELDTVAGPNLSLRLSPNHGGIASQGSEETNINSAHVLPITRGGSDRATKKNWIVGAPLGGPSHQWIALQAFLKLPPGDLRSEMESHIVTNAEDEVYHVGIATLLAFELSRPNWFSITGEDNTDHSISPHEAVIQGVYEEDAEAEVHDTIDGTHFWDPDATDPKLGFELNGRIYKSAIREALQEQEELDPGAKLRNGTFEKAVAAYPESKPEAYYWLGRTAHLLADVSVPAHTHLDGHAVPIFSEAGEDTYEFVASRYYDTITAQSIGTAIPSLKDLVLPDHFSDTYRSEAAKLFYSLAKTAKQFDSDHRNGASIEFGMGKFRSARSNLSAGKLVQRVVLVKPTTFEEIAELQKEKDYDIFRLGEQGEYFHIYYYKDFYESIKLTSQLVRVHYTDGDTDTYLLLDRPLNGATFIEPIRYIYMPVLQAKAIGYTAALYQLFWDKTHTVPQALDLIMDVSESSPPVTFGGTNSEAGWKWQSSTTHDGEDSSQSPGLQSNQHSIMKTVATGPSKVSFWYKTSGIPGDEFRILVAGTEHATGNLNPSSWRMATISIPAGQHTLEWKFTTGSESSSVRYAWVDELQTVGIQWLGALPGNRFYSEVTAISPDGQVVVGQSNGNISGSFSDTGFRWTASSGMTQLANLYMNAATYPTGVSNRGEVIAGTTATQNFTSAAVLWTSGRIIQLPPLSGQLFPPHPATGGYGNSGALGISNDGSVAVGDALVYRNASASQWTGFATRWWSGTGQNLGNLIGGPTAPANSIWSLSYAVDVSADGSVVVGTGTNGSNQREAFRWTASSGMVGLNASEAHAVSGNGEVVIGHEYRWSSVSGEIPMPGFRPSGISYDGRVIVGTGSVDNRTGSAIWRETYGLRLLEDVLRADYGVGIGGRQLHGNLFVSDDGKAITGTGINADGKSEAFVVTLLPQNPSAPDTSLDNMDSDNDGFSNLLEEALGEDPTSTPIVQINLSSIYGPTVEYLRNTNISNVEYLLELSGDLQDWKEISGPEVVSQTTPGREKVQARIEINKPLFARVRVIRTFPPGTPSPDIKLVHEFIDLSSGQQLEFSSRAGDSSEHSITVHNEGVRDLTSFSVSISGSDPGNFQILASNFPKILVPGQSADLRIAFTPPRIGTFPAVLRLSSNDPDETQVEIRLRGVSVEPTSPPRNNP